MASLPGDRMIAECQARIFWRPAAADAKKRAGHPGSFYLAIAGRCCRR